MTESAPEKLESRLLALAAMHCRGGAPRLAADELDVFLTTLSGWSAPGNTLEKSFTFPHYHATIAFVNALAWIAHREDHHPDLAVHYDRCVVTFATHSAGGVTLNDVICAARLERLFA